MVTFLTLFIEVVTGMQSVQVAVAGPVARVVLYLDSRPVATMTAPPWKATIPLDSTLEPRALTAAAYDRNGHELGRDRQLLNLPQRQADARIVPVTDGSMRVKAARLVWWAPGLGVPHRISCSVDGRPVPTTGSEAVDLSGFANEQTHVLEARLEFRNDVVCERTLLFGGGQLTATSAELTAIPIVLKNKRPPRPRTWDGWFRANGEDLVVDAIDDDPALIIVVRDLGVWDTLSPWLEVEERMASTRAGRAAVFLTGRRQYRRESAALVRVGEPVPSGRDVSASRSVSLFTFTKPGTSTWYWLPWFITDCGHRQVGTAERKVADAVAVAANLAARDNRRRAVVLCLGQQEPDGSTNAAGAVRRYLQDLRVPLLVWRIRPAPKEQSTDEQLAEASDQKWVDVKDIGSLMALRKEVTRLKELIEHQRIVWVRGAHLPQEITLGPNARDIRLAGATDPIAAHR
jgi:hypothetical protein